MQDLQLDRFRNYVTEISGGLLEISAPQANSRFDQTDLDSGKSSSAKILFGRWMAVGEIVCGWLNSSFAKDLLLRHKLLTYEEIFTTSQCAKGSHEGLLTWLQDGHSGISDRARECIFVAAAHHDLVEEIQGMLSTGVTPTSRDLDGCTACIRRVRG